MRAARLVTMLLLLQARGRMSGQDLAEALEVSVRTVYRDVEALSGGGVPIYAERGANGGFRLLEGYRLQLETLTAAEASALPFLALPDVAAAFGVEEARASAALKFEQALPPPHRELAEATTKLVHVDVAPSAADGRALPWLQALLSAARSERTVEVTTNERDGSVALDPLGVVYRDGWHAVGLVEGEPVALRVGAIRRVTGTHRRFQRPEGFDLRAWWRDR